MASILAKKQKKKAMVMASILEKKPRKKTLKLKEVKTLGLQLLSSKEHINNLPLLLTFINPTSEPQLALESLLSLHSFFTLLLPDLFPSKSIDNDNENEEFIYRSWLRSKFDEFIQSVITVAISPLSEETLREVVLDTLMEFVKVGSGGKYNSFIYHKFIHSIVYSTSGVDSLLTLLVAKYFKYIDVRYFSYISLEKIARTLDVKDVSDEKDACSDDDNKSQARASRELIIQKIHHMLSAIPPLEKPGENYEYEMLNDSGVFTKEGNNKEHTKLPEAEDERSKTRKSSNNVLSQANIPKKMKLKFTKAWVAFLGLPLPIDVYKEILVTLDQAVIPQLSNPIMLCDFLTQSYDIGGVISVMALSSLFILMTEHGLEYPNFYKKLYALLKPSIFMAKHRARFFQLLDSCLKSPLLPGYLAAAFAKKLSSLALSAPPSGGLVIMALIHNLLRRHPSINCLVHWEDVDEKVEDVSVSENKKDMSIKMPGLDHFKNDEVDLVKTNALRSSLWEIDTLRHHYCPPVSTFVLSLETDLTVRAKTTEVAVKDFSSGSYATIFREEIRRRVKQVPLAFYKTTPTSLFSESDFPGWTFDCSVDVSGDSNSEKRQRIE